MSSWTVSLWTASGAGVRFLNGPLHLNSTPASDKLARPIMTSEATSQRRKTKTNHCLSASPDLEILSGEMDRKTNFKNPSLKKVQWLRTSDVHVEEHQRHNSYLGAIFHYQMGFPLQQLENTHISLENFLKDAVRMAWRARISNPLQNGFIF